MLQRNMNLVSWEETCSKGTKAMKQRLRPIHSGFETLRLAGSAYRTSRDYHRLGSLTHEQLTATGYRIVPRPASIFSDFRSR